MSEHAENLRRIAAECDPEMEWETFIADKTRAAADRIEALEGFAHRVDGFLCNVAIEDGKAAQELLDDCRHTMKAERQRSAAVMAELEKDR